MKRIGYLLISGASFVGMFWFAHQAIVYNQTHDDIAYDLQRLMFLCLVVAPIMLVKAILPRPKKIIKVGQDCADQSWVRKH